MRALAAVLVLVLATAAAAEPAVNGFITVGRGELRGVVTDDDGAPLSGVKVHLVSSSGKTQVVTTAKNGTYRADLLGGTHTLVYIEGPGQVTGAASLPTGSDGVIEIHDTEPVAVMATPISKADLIPAYSDAAIEADVWTRAWLMLDVSERGEVSRVKLLNRPGFDLDDIAIRHAMQLRFQPARSAAKQPIRSLVLWSYEWPAYWWMRKGRHALTRLPAAIADAPCRRPDLKRPWDRDCSRPDLAGSISKPWLNRK